MKDVNINKCDKQNKYSTQMWHWFCITSNLIYCLSGLIALLLLKGPFKILGVLMIYMGVVSAFHHYDDDGEKNTIWLSNKTWQYLDVSMANLGILIYIFLNILFVRTTKIHSKKLLYISLFLFVISLSIYLVSQIEGGHWLHSYISCKYKRDEIYLAFHSIWHILSAIFMLTWVFFISSNKIDE